MSDDSPMASPLPESAGVIDTHHHMIPPFYLEAMGMDKIAAVMPNGKAPDWSPALDGEVMDEFRISKAVLSVSPGIWGLPPDATQRLAHQVNDYGARLVADHPTRYGHFAILPLPDIDASLKEAAYALDTLKANGLIIFTNYAGAYLGDPHFEPLWEELGRRGAVVFIHPTNVPYQVTHIPASVLEFPFDTTRTVTSLIYGGVTVRHPAIRFICSHGGGTIPFLAGRIDGPTRMNPALHAILPDGVMPELRKFYWDTALTFEKTALSSLLALTDASKIVFGTDFPFAPKFMMSAGQKSLNRELPTADLNSVLHTSALRLMPSLGPPGVRTGV
jgi:predicted TIM-barrel fold metal-dependent hydrolase